MKDTSVPTEVEKPIPPLEDVVLKWKEIKLKQAKLATELSECNDQILHYTGKKESGSTTIHTPTDTIKVDFKGDWECDDWDALKAEVAEPIFDAVARTKYEVDVVPTKKLLKAGKYPALAKHISRIPGNAYIQIKERTA